MLMANLHNTGHMSSKILQAVVQMIDVSISRATWKGEEIAQIANLREIFTDATAQALTAEQALAQEIANNDEEEESSEFVA